MAELIPGKLGSEEGFLISYNDFCAMLALPKGYFFDGISDQGDAVLFRFVKDTAFKRNKDGLVRAGQPHFYFLTKTKEEVAHKLNIDYDTFNAWIMARQQGNVLRKIWPHPANEDYMLNRNNLFIWITEIRYSAGENIFYPER